MSCSILSLPLCFRLAPQYSLQTGFGHAQWPTTLEAQINLVDENVKEKGVKVEEVQSDSMTVARITSYDSVPTAGGTSTTAPETSLITTDVSLADASAAAIIPEDAEALRVVELAAQQAWKRKRKWQDRRGRKASRSASEVR